MSAPPSRPKGLIRGRGGARGGGRLRASGTRINGMPAGGRPSLNETSKNNLQRQLKDAPRSNQSRGRSTQKDATSRQGAPQLSQASHRNKMEDWRTSVADYNASYKAKMADLYQTLKTDRENERKEAIRNGFLADPDKPTSLANAITPVGTCEDMCPQFERVERIVQLMVDNSEKETAQSGAKVPCEALMVKRFRRSAAGYDEQLPSDIRPPAVLKKTLDYLINDVVGGSETLSAVHKFVWDRTRGIRNDFSIQQVTKTEDLRIAIDCFERIARFHIVSLHQLSRTDLKENEFDHYQEREQLNNTLLSLMYYYDDSRQKLTSPNEPEFRAYCILFEIQDQRPDLEDRMQGWPWPILKDRRVQTALKLYAAAGNTMDEQGPLRPRTAFSLAQSNAYGFWSLVQSHSVSYLMACVAEVYFNLVRASALEIIWKAYRVKRGGSSKVEDWTLKNMTFALGFDEDEQTAQFCEEHEFTIAEGEGGQSFVDLGSVAGANIRDTNPRRKQMFSRAFVEAKRLRRTLPAIIDGFTASKSHEQGFVEESSDMEDVAADEEEESLFIEDEATGGSSNENAKSAVSQAPSRNGATASPFAAAGFGKSSSLFSFSNSDSAESKQPQTSSITTSDNHTTQNNFLNPFPSVKPATFNPFQKPSTSSAAPFNGPITDTTKTAEAQKDSTAFTETSLTATKSTSQAPSPFNPFSPASSRSDSTTGANSQKETSIFPPVASTASTKTGSIQQLKAPASSGFPQNPPKFDGASLFNFQSPPSTVTQQSAVSTTLEGSSTGTGLFKAVQQPHSNTAAHAFPTSQTSEEQQDAAKSAATSKPFTFFAPTQSNNDINKSSTAPSSLFPSSTSEPSQQTPTPSFLFQPPAQPIKAPVDPPAKDSTAISTTPAQPFHFPTPFPPPQALATAPISSSGIPASVGPSANLQQTARPDITKEAPAWTSSTITKPAPADLRPKALDKISEIMMTGEGGLLQQFVEFTIGPIIQAAIIKDGEEKSWTRARKYRRILLAKKYVKRWKTLSWNLGLQRRARERRVNLAQSVRKAAAQTQSTPTHASFNPSPATSANERAQVTLNGDSSSMAPPPAKVSSKRQSMPSRLIEEGRNLLKSMSSAGSKRKRSEEEEIQPGNLSQMARSQHRRTKTLATSTMSAPPHRQVKPSSRNSIDSSRIGDGSLLGDTLLRQARRLAQGTKLDTTKSDYFTLKARGIDPDTPTVPEVHKRSRPRPEGTPTTPSQQASPASSTEPSSVAQVGSKALVKSDDKASGGDDDDDAALFASIRAVRQTLAESADWFQNNRQSLERSMTPKTDASPPRPETAAERRLREIRERGHTPTRSELRQRAMKNPIFPMKAAKEHSKEEAMSHCNGSTPDRSLNGESPRPVKRGFAALAQSTQTNGLNRDAAAGHKPRESPNGLKGDSVEDAIEL